MLLCDDVSTHALLAQQPAGQDDPVQAQRPLLQTCPLAQGEQDAPMPHLALVCDSRQLFASTSQQPPRTPHAELLQTQAPAPSQRCPLPEPPQSTPIATFDQRVVARDGSHS